MRNLRQLAKLQQNIKINQQLYRRQDFPRNVVNVDLPVSEQQVEQPTTFKQGDQAPYAYNDVWSYPKDFKPWNFNYKGDGIIFGCLAGLFYAYFQYEATYCKRTGRLERIEKDEYYRL
ncbi:hypothetical protein PPERSA_03615 [Pseudocohnilembus persalinus]|uniref:Uncharacterized protein n=1 Tax=Pseudocohnilembus persalinus TaxID=266149 RepID=A0A0V0QDW3_PSEPJ|nr:hypothetical protein PPERSA_03615 [Pseudocohnilembus persalinus]|eukprot:KRX00394.1 hypothetical protein PPERSA_03615 [Pseudocohnilembus persalinus]